MVDGLLDGMQVLWLQDDDAALLRRMTGPRPAGVAHRITYVDCLADALNRLESTRAPHWDVVISALDVTDSEGVETVRALLESTSQTTPVLVLASLSGRLAAVQAVRAGAAAYVVTDDLDAGLLQATVSQVVERAYAQARQRATYAASVGRQRAEALGRLSTGLLEQVTESMVQVRSLVQFLGDDARPDQVADLEQVGATAERLTTLMQKLSRLGEGAGDGPTASDINQLVRSCALTLDGVVGRHIDVELDLATDLGLVEVERALLEVALVHLVVNACDAMPDGGRVRLATRAVSLSVPMRMNDFVLPAGHWSQLTLSDDGHGMSEPIRRRCFEPYVTTRRRATGVGLASVYGIVKQHGGYIAVHSFAGAGTVFEVYLPLSTETVQQGAPSASLQLDTLAGTETILLAEPDDACRRQAATALQERGYRVIEADTASLALTLLSREQGVAALVVDTALGGTEAVALVRRARAAFPELTVIPITTERTGGALQHPLTHVGLLEGVRSALDAA